jgi:hypothetical protein
VRELLWTLFLIETCFYLVLPRLLGIYGMYVYIYISIPRHIYNLVYKAHRTRSKVLHAGPTQVNHSRGEGKPWNIITQYCSVRNLSGETTP